MSLKGMTGSQRKPSSGNVGAQHAEGDGTLGRLVRSTLNLRRIAYAKEGII